MSKTVAEILVKYLAMGGVSRIYGIPGDSIDPLVDAIRVSNSLKYVQVRHEEGGAFAASFDAKFNGEPSACFGTSGPGSIHLLNGLYDAKKDRVPVIAITGQIRRDLTGLDYHQEVNLVKLFDDVSVYNQMVSDAESAPYIISRAIREAKRLKGIAHLNFPVNVLMQKTDEPRFHNLYLPRPNFSPDISNAIELIENSRRPVLLIGAGTAGESEALRALADKIGAPIIYALLGKGILSDGDPLVLGGLGLLGTKPSVDAIEGADLIIEVGSSFPYRNFIPKGTRIIQVDMDAGNLAKNFTVDVPILSDSSSFLDGVMKGTSEKKAKYYSEFQSKKEAWQDYLVREENKDSDYVNPALLARILSEEAKSDAVVITDTGNTTVWIARHFRAKKSQRFLFSGGLATMGCALPGSIGVALSTSRQVISAIGDGGFLMTSSELSTVRKYNIPIKVVIFNNSKLGMIKFEQEVLGYPEWGVDLVNPDFSTLVSAYGIESMHIDKDSEIRNGVSRMLNSSGPFLLEVITNPNLRPLPPRITLDQARGYLVANIKERIGYTPEFATDA